MSTFGIVLLLVVFTPVVPVTLVAVASIVEAVGFAFGWAV